MCKIRLKAEARKPSLGSGFMTSLKLVHQGLQTILKKRKKGFLESQLLVSQVREKNKIKKKGRCEQAEGNTISMELFDIFLNGKKFLLKNIAVTNHWVFSLPQ